MQSTASPLAKLSLIIIGLIFCIVAISVALYGYLSVSHWKTANVVSTTQQSGGCDAGAGKRYVAGNYYTYTYNVKGVSHTLSSPCSASAPTQAQITYNPSNPAQSTTSFPILDYVLAGFVGFVGIIFLIGGIFVK